MIRARSSTTHSSEWHVPTWVHLLGGWQHRHPAAAIRLGNAETALLRDVLEGIQVDRPVYIAGLARAGTTKLLELLAAHPAVVTHRYLDFPPLFTPYWWNRWLALLPQRPQQAQERAHRDGITVTAESPEAFEEVLWMAFFPHLHDPARQAGLDRTTRHPAFEQFYDEHIRKLLAVRGGSRYVVKGNYNLTRLPYLHQLYPAARFVVVVRDPVWHIASLIKQQRLFAAGESQSPRALEHMRRVGHYEFGLDRRPVNAGRSDITARVAELWVQGKEVEGWAIYWADLYRHVADTLTADAALRHATLLVSYEALCEQPRATLANLFEHCELNRSADQIADAATGLHPPDYYRPDFTRGELELIARVTGPVASRLAVLAANSQLASASGSPGRSVGGVAG